MPNANRYPWEGSVDELRGALRGEVITAGEPGFDDARALWNASYDRTPGLIVRCANAQDVIAAVNFARTNNVSVAVRSGGHNVACTGSCDGGLMIDLSRMKGMGVDAQRRIARAEAGLTWGEFDRETQMFGLATTGGICSQTGIGGVTLGGGFGWLMRKYGLALDNILSMDVVTADGKLRKVTASEHADLFFGMRGSQSNLGIVTAFEYRLHAVGPTVLAGMVLHPLDRGREVLQFYRDYTSEAPEEMSAWAAMLTSPDGHRMLAILACYVGNPADGEKVLRPLRTFGPPVADMIQPMPYVRAQSLIDEAFPRGRFNYWKSSLLSVLDDRVIEILVSGFGHVASPYSSVLIEHLGGAMNRIAKGETAFPHRTAAYDVVIMPMWLDAAESPGHARWADDLWNAVQPFSTGGVYVNYLGNEGPERVRAAYGVNHERLAALKYKYDGTNLFRWNQNIPPSASGVT